MGILIKLKGKQSKVFLFFFFTILFSQVFLHQVVADEIKDGPLEINSGDWFNIQLGTNTTIFWQFQVDTNERAIYWEIIGDNVFKTGWGPTANCTTPVLNGTDTRYEFVCHGYYAKYYVWSKVIVTCTEIEPTNGGGDNGDDPIFFLYLGISIVLVTGISIAVAFYLKYKKNQESF